MVGWWAVGGWHSEVEAKWKQRWGWKWKWNTHGQWSGGLCEGTQVWWSGRDSEAALVEGCKAEVGLHYREESSSMRETI